MSIRMHVVDLARGTNLPVHVLVSACLVPSEELNIWGRSETKSRKATSRSYGTER